MDQPDTDDSVWGSTRRFVDRHIRFCTKALCILAAPIALLFLIPAILVTAASTLTAPVRLKATLSLTYLDKDGKVTHFSATFVEGDLIGRKVPDKK